MHSNYAKPKINKYSESAIGRIDEVIIFLFLDEFISSHYDYCNLLCSIFHYVRFREKNLIISDS